MEDNDFLDAVLPAEGPYCVCELTTKKREHIFVQSREQAQACAFLFDQANKNAYFALASFTPDTSSRKAEHAQRMRSLFVDIDCGEGKAYPTKRAGVEALASFLESSQIGELGSPWVVDSGGGVHAYWPLTEDVSIPEWKDLAERFKRLCAEQRLRIDMTVTADAARVLRVPGTTNWKYPKPVVLKARGDSFQYADLMRVVRSHNISVPLQTPSNELAMLPGAPLKRTPDAVGVKIMANTATFFKDIVVRTVTTSSGCGQLKHYLEHAQEDGMEPLWRGLLTLTKVCDDGWKAAQKISSLHPYDDERLKRKWDEVKGPYPCTKFDSENPGICPNCPHWGKITNPLRLGATLKVDETEKMIDVIQNPSDPTLPPERYVRPKAPRGFSYGEKGGIYKNELVDDEETGGKTKRDILILAYDMFVLEILRQGGVHSAQMVIEREGRYVTLTYPMRAAVSKDDTLKFLAENNVVAYGAGNDKRLFEYVRSAVEEASQRKAPTLVPTQYGWQEDGSFVFSGTVYYPDGTQKRVPMPDLENLAHNTRVAGNLDGWRKIVSLLDRRELHEVVAHMCIGFGSPLMCFSGLHGLTFHAGHTKSGTGKSLALNLCASIWGSPQQYRTGSKTSVVAMQQRAGNLNGLPFLVDELTGLAREHMTWFPEWTFTFSEGKGKERMEAGANKERINNTKWNGLAFFTSNTFMLDIMTGAMEHSMEGEIRRFLEWNPSVQLAWGPGELDIIKTMDVHYGVAGEAYAKWLVTNRETAQRVWKRVYEKLFKDFEATNDERFWVAGCASIVAGATLCGPTFADIYPFDAKAIQEALYADVKRGRDALRRATRRAEDVLNAYVRDFYGQFIVIRPVDSGMSSTAKSLVAQFGHGEELDVSLTRTKVLGRVEKEVTPGWTDFYVEERLLKRHCASMSFGYNDFLEGVSKICSTDRVQKNLTQGTRAPMMRVAAVRFRRRTEDMLNGELEAASST